MDCEGGCVNPRSVSPGTDMALPARGPHAKLRLALPPSMRRFRALAVTCTGYDNCDAGYHLMDSLSTVECANDPCSNGDCCEGQLCVFTTETPRQSVTGPKRSVLTTSTPSPPPERNASFPPRACLRNRASIYRCTIFLCPTVLHRVSPTAWSGTCADGTLKTLSTRTADNQCGSCNPGYRLNDMTCIGS